MSQRIGVLCREGAAVYYAFPHGYNKLPIEGPLDIVERALGIRPPLPETQVAQPLQKPKRWLLVTVIPEIVTYAGTSSYGEYTVEVYAPSSANAITQVRQQRRDEHGRFAVRAKYKARLLHLIAR